MKEPYTPHAEWRKQFEFKPLYNDPAPHVTHFEHTNPPLPFVADPLLAYWSTQKTGPGPV
jgi:hypothetical protein